MLEKAWNVRRGSGSGSGVVRQADHSPLPLNLFAAAVAGTRSDVIHQPGRGAKDWR